MKNKMKYGWVLLMLCGMKAYSQEQKSLQLQEAIELSVKNSKQLRASQARIEEASAAVDEAKEKRLPNASVSGSYLRLNSANITMKSQSSGGGSGNGGGEPKVNQLAYGLLNVSQPIYDGGRIRFGIESAEFLKKAISLDADNAREEIVQNTIEAYANLFKAHTAVRLMQESLASSQQRVKELGNMEKNGLLARNDLLKAQLQSSNVELSLLDAQNNEQVAMVNMNLMLGLPTETLLVLDTNGIEKKNDDRVLDDYLKLAGSNRKDMAATDLRKKAAEAGIRVAKSDMYPSLNLTGGYIAADIPNFFSITNALNVGVGVSYNIGSLWKTKSKIKQAEARVKQIEANEAQLDDAIRLQVNRNYLSLLSSRKKIDVNAVAVAQAEENYRIVKNKFDNSLATTTELLDADVAQLQARMSYTLARADAFVAYHKLLQTTGTLSTQFLKQ